MEDEDEMEEEEEEAGGRRGGGGGDPGIVTVTLCSSPLALGEDVIGLGLKLEAADAELLEDHLGLVGKSHRPNEEVYLKEKVQPKSIPAMSFISSGRSQKRVNV